MKSCKLLTIIIFLIFSSLTGISYAESLKFDSSTYEGEVVKSKAHGVGIFTFSDGSTYEGKVNKNRIHGMGKYTDSKGKVYEGKFRYGTIKIKVDKKTRGIVNIKPKTGFETYVEMKGTDATSTKWFEAAQNSSGTYELTAQGKADMEVAKAASASSGSSGSSGSGC